MIELLFNLIKEMYKKSKVGEQDFLYTRKL